MSLNPCSNGIWSLTQQVADETKSQKCLNPCSNGIWSLTIDSLNEKLKDTGS